MRPIERQRICPRLRAAGTAALTALALVLLLGGCGDDGGGSGGPADGGAPDVADASSTGDAGTDGGAAADVAMTPDGTADGAAPGDGGADAGTDAAADGAADVPPPVPCGTDSPAALAACVDETRAVEHLAALVSVRPTGSAPWQAAQDYCASALSGYGFTVERQAYGGGVNVIGTRQGTTRADELVVIGAHYDHIEGCPGADDNASGVAGALEAARVLAQVDHARTLVVACWDEEENGLVGSQAWVERLAQAGGKVAVYFNFEMIGYASAEPDSQRFPGGFGLIFPAIEELLDARQWRGDFIAAITDPGSSPAAAAMKAHGDRIGLPLIEVPLTQEQTTWDGLADLRRSDHAAFWAAGYPALMITDTSEFRNPNYHCRDGEDTLETLDTAFLRGVVAITVGAAAERLAATDALAAPTPRHACGLGAPACPEAGQKCAPLLDAYDLWAFGCTAAGAVAHEAECARPTNEPGADTCVAGEFCTFWGLPEEDPVVRFCRTLCTVDEPCAEGQVCRRLDPSPSAGLCVTPCDPAGAPCGAGLKCGRRFVIDAIGTVTVCDWTRADGGDGTPCTADWDCADALGCELDAHVCRPWCDAAHACAAGTCTPVRAAADPARGLCVP